MLCALAVGVCSCNTGPRALQWELEYAEPALEEDVLAYRLAIIAGGCPAGTQAPPPGSDGGVDADATAGLDAALPFDAGRDAGAAMDAGLPSIDGGFSGVPGSVRYEVELRRGEVAEMNPPVLDPGGWGFLVEARDGSCGTVAVGCTPLDLPLDAPSVTVRLAAETLAAPCQPGRCIDGLCGMPDASVEVPDGCIPRDEFCNRADDDCDGYVDEDFDLQRDTMNCGSCGNFCPPVANGAVTCDVGACRTECEEDFSFCPGDRGTCDTDLSQPSDCGSCGNFCPTEAPICGGTEGARRCVDTCGPGQLLCGRTCVDPVNDANHCGGCNIDCSRPSAVTECAAGGCALVSCAPDYEDCDGDLDNGCEQFTREDENNCGGCGVACTDCQSCSSGTCTARSNFSSCGESDDGESLCIDGACCGGCFVYDGFRGDDTTCEPGTTLESCGTAGEACEPCEGECRTCATGSCEPAPDGTLCTDGVCGGGACCSTCLDGDGTCRPNSAAFCGTGGDSCVACECGDDVCAGGSCSVGTPATSLDAGDFHTCARLGTQLHCWGENRRGQLGVGSSADFLATPQRVTFPFAGSVGEFATGQLSTCAIVGSRLYCWGDNTNNVVGAGAALSRSPIQIAGTWRGAEPLGIGRAHGCGTSMADPPDGDSLFCWGNNTAGQLGNGSTSASVFGPEVILPTVGDAIPHAGDAHTCVRVGEDIRCAGSNDQGRLGYSTEPDAESTTFETVLPGTRWKSLAVGSDFSCGVQVELTLWCWGRNESGQLGQPGGSALLPQQVGTEAVWDRVYAGVGHACAIRGVGGPGELWCWGDNEFGQVGNGVVGGVGAVVDRPVRVGTGLWRMAAPGEHHTCGIDESGAVHCWGQNAQGQLGIASGASLVASPTPQRVCFP